jgi:hypothetical protein
MKRQWMDMKYNKKLSSWFVVQGEREYMLHCGEWFDLSVGEDKGIPCRLELARQWYVIMGNEGVKLSLRTNEIYKIEV